ncbi:MAG: hypothetical protein HY217_09210 [Candidatus Rokubacteria bacterium]|nr:hypothetical protein [Candidatus Rokubacteria bacterium]
MATILRSAAEVLASWWTARWLRAAIVAGGLGQLRGTALFVLNMWSRVRMPSAAGP